MIAKGLLEFETLDGVQIREVIEHGCLPKPSTRGIIRSTSTTAVLVITAYADQKFKEVDPNIVTGVIRKPFEIADLGNIIRLCVAGFDEAVLRANSSTSAPATRLTTATSGPTSSLSSTPISSEPPPSELRNAATGRANHAKPLWAIVMLEDRPQTGWQMNERST